VPSTQRQIASTPIMQMSSCWAAGYISGINSLNKDAFFDLSAVTSDEMKRYLRQYCNEHPFAEYGME
jgi:hypothetical protein